MKKLTKEQKEQRKIMIHKLKRVGFIISLVLNALFITIAIIGCSTTPKSDVQHAKVQQQDNIAKVIDKNYLTSYELNSKAHSYDLRVNAVSYKPSEIVESYYADYYVSLGNETGVVVRNNSTGTMVALDNEVHVQFRINASSINNSLIWINWGDGVLNSYVADINSNSWVAWNIDTSEPLPLYNNEIYLPNSLGYNSSNYDLFRTDLAYWFNEIDYYDIDLTYWSPYAFVQNSFITSGVQQGVKYVIKDCLFAINGNIYDRIYYFLSVGDTYIYDNGTSYQLQAGQGYIAFVVAENSLNNHSLPLMECETKPINPSGSSGTTLAVVKDSLRFVNNANTKVRLWDSYANDVSEYSSSYTNYSILTATFSGFTSNVSSSVGDFGDVFGLMGTAFHGLFDILQVNILPGISLAMFVMLPLVAIIIFAIIKILKK